MALLYLEHVKLQQMSREVGYAHVQEHLTEARARLTHVTPIKCCPAVVLAIWLDMSIVRRLYVEQGKEIDQTLHGWTLLRYCVSPAVEERDKYADTYDKQLLDLFTPTAPRHLAINSSPYLPSYYNPSQVQLPSATSRVIPANIQPPPRSIAGYTTDSSYRSLTEQYSKPLLGQYQQHAIPNYNTSPNNSPNTGRQQQQVPPNLYMTHSSSTGSFHSDQHSHSH